MVLAQLCERVVSGYDIIMKIVYLTDIGFFADLKLTGIVRDLISYPSQVFKSFVRCFHHRDSKTITIGDMLQIVNIPAYTISASVYIRAKTIQALVRFKKLIVQFLHSLSHLLFSHTARI